MPQTNAASVFTDLAKSLNTPSQNTGIKPVSFGNDISNQQYQKQEPAKMTVTEDRLDDIKTKLERYRREREELDQIRQKF